MPTCKDCIHYEPCRDTYYNDEKQTRIDFDFLIKEDADKNCAFFKNRSKFVELPLDINKMHYVVVEGNIKGAKWLYGTVTSILCNPYLSFVFKGVLDTGVIGKITINYKAIKNKAFNTQIEVEQALKERESE